jgi:hypothetical protein
MEKAPARSAEEGVNGDHYALLTRMIEAVSRDHAQLRLLVYELARRKLRRNLYAQFEEGDWPAIQEHMRKLEAAIERVETDCARKDPPLTFVSEPPLTFHPATGGAVGQRATLQEVATSKVVMPLAGRGAPASVAFSAPRDITRRLSPRDDDVYVANRRPQRSRSTFWWKVQLSVAVLLGVVIYAAIDGRSALGFLGLLRFEAATNAPRANAGDPGANIAAAKTPDADKVRRPSAPTIPVPTEYGAYALSKGQLTELDVLPMRVPDQRVAISAVIPTPSRTHLPPGKLEFVVFRRDFANSAPDRIALRVVAQVVRALTFDARGKPATVDVENSWVVRSNSYQMRVAPVAENPEMVLIRPDPPDFVLPAGRYALVLKNVAYDFTVDGPLTDIAHCLERTDALSSAVYTECRSL